MKLNPVMVILIKEDEDFDYLLMNYCKENISDDISNNNKENRRLKNNYEQVKN